ncbi:MAG: hypothetical protein OEM62_07165 [Acidobacteriota bacterium]|nr:hypothetical protein [Acidobacteriota bacterium]
MSYNTDGCEGEVNSRARESGSQGGAGVGAARSEARYNKMDVADLDLVRNLLVRRRVLALSLLIDGEPFVSQLPFAVRADTASLLIHASSLARHSRGLNDGARFSALIQAADAPDDDPFQISRLTLTGTVRVLAPASDDYAAARSTYLEQLPTGRVTFSLADFRLIELVVENGRLVAGFARTANLTAGTIKQALEGAAAVGQESAVEGGGKERSGDSS